MASTPPHETRHTVTIAAPADAVYRLIADVGAWPQMFVPTLHVDRLEGDDRGELLRLWAMANGEVRTWTSRRELDPGAGRVRFRQERTSPPVRDMGGEWVIAGTGPDTTEVVLLHDFTVADDDPDRVAWVRAAVDRNSEAELAALRSAAEQGRKREELVHTFSDSIMVAGSVEEVYEVLFRADRWPDRLPHVSRVELTEGEGGVQVIEMDTRSTDGSVHTTRSIRVGSSPHRIVYKQTKFPPILAAHTGRWELTQTPGWVRATSWHTIVLREEKVTEVLGPDATVAEAGERVRRALSTNSAATLRVAKEIVESARV